MVNSEVSLLIKLKHPNVIGFREAIFSSEKERMFLVLEYCHRGSMLSLVNQHLTLTEWEWMEVVRKNFIQMVEGIAFSTPPPT